MHDMNIESVFGVKLNLCKICGAHHDRKRNLWFSVGAFSKEEPPCNLNSQEWKEWQARATKYDDCEPFL